MKSCPTCNRTFEDTFTFCLVDGSILSAPFNPQATWQNPNVRNTDPPPTEVMPPPNYPNRDALPPTMPSPNPAYVPPPINAASYPQPPPQFPQGQYAVSSPQKRRPPIPWSIPRTLAGLVLLVLIFGGRDKLISLWGLLIAAMLSAINLIKARPNSQNTQGQYIASIPQKKRATIPWTIPIALAGLGLIGRGLFVFFPPIYFVVLLTTAIILSVINLVTGGRVAR